MHNRGYASRREHRGGSTLFHKHIVQGEFIDHVNQNRLDNRRKNLRVTTCSSNIFNSRRKLISETGIEGVRKNGGNFSARITVDGKTYCKTFKTLSEASAERKRMEHKNYEGVKHTTPLTELESRLN